MNDPRRQTKKAGEQALRCSLSLSLLRLAWQPLPVRRGRAPSGRLASLSLFHTLTHTPLLLFAVCQTEKTERQCEQKQDSPSEREKRGFSRHRKGILDGEGLVFSSSSSITTSTHHWPRRSVHPSAATTAALCFVCSPLLFSLPVQHRHTRLLLLLL